MGCAGDLKREAGSLICMYFSSVMLVTQNVLPIDVSIAFLNGRRKTHKEINGKSLSDFTKLRDSEIFKNYIKLYIYKINGLSSRYEKP